jgi:MFS transporter, ACS family, allantoate permease
MDDKADNRSSADAEKGLDGHDLTPKETIGNGDVGDIVILKHANPNDADEAMKAFVGQEGEMVVMTPEMERALLRKIDWNLMPVCIFTPSSLYLYIPARNLQLIEN